MSVRPGGCPQGHSTRHVKRVRAQHSPETMAKPPRNIALRTLAAPCTQLRKPPGCLLVGPPL